MTRLLSVHLHTFNFVSICNHRKTLDVDIVEVAGSSPVVPTKLDNNNEKLQDFSLLKPITVNPGLRLKKVSLVPIGCACAHSFTCFYFQGFVLDRDFINESNSHSLTSKHKSQNRYWPVAQSVEQSTVNAWVACSSHAWPANRDVGLGFKENKRHERNEQRGLIR